MIAGYPHAHLPANRQVLQPGQWPGFQGRASAPATAMGAMGLQSFTAPSMAPPLAPNPGVPPMPGFAHPSFSTQHAAPVATHPGHPVVRQQLQDSRRPEIRTTGRLQEARADGGVRLQRQSNHGAAARLQQELHAHALHEAPPSDDKMPMPHFEHKPEPYAYLERRLQWIQEDLQRQQTRLVEESLPKQAPREQDMSAMHQMLQRMQVERRGREELESKISGLESTLMKERAEHNLGMQQMQQHYEKVMNDLSSHFEHNLKVSQDNLFRQAQRLEDMLKATFQNVENRLASGAFSKDHWVPISLERDAGGESTTPNWLTVAGGHGHSGLGARKEVKDVRRQMVSGPLVAPGRAKSPMGPGGSMKCSRGGAGGPGAEEPMMSGKTLGEMLQRLHQENQELQRVHHELSQQKSRKSSKETSKNHSPIQTPGKYPQWPLYRPAG